LWFGAWMIASAVTATAATAAAIASTTTTNDDDKNQKWRLQERQSNSNTKKKTKWTIFGLIVTNPGLLWLDSIHFQYNGFLLGILLLSLSCLVRGNHHHASNSRIWFHVWHILAAMLFAFLLTLKHLYMTLSLWYFAYLFRRYCFGHQRTTTTQTASRIWTTGLNNDPAVVFKPMRLLILGVVTVTTLVVPFLPFFQSSSSSSSSSSNNHHRTAMDQARRIFERLFPFGRGLVHDYWAGNVWAIYMAMTKIFPALKAYEPSPKRVIGLLLGALLPGAVVAWKAAAVASKADADEVSTASRIQSSKAQQQQLQQVKARIVASELLWSSFTYTTMAAFMMAYHVHEKAILTTLLPMTIWLCCSLDGRGYNHHQDVASQNDDNHLSPPVHASSSSAAAGGLLLWRTMAFGLLGLFPLLFHPTELLLKVFSFTAYLVVLDQKINILRRPVRSSSSSFQSSPPRHRLLYTFFTTRCFQLVLVWFFSAAVILILECIPLRYFGRYEFVPLTLTSLTTALGLLISFLEVSWRMMHQAVAKHD
jgi:Ca2+/Na+ antiporter